MAKTIRLVAIGCALAAGGAVVALLPSANAADAKSAQEIMSLCDLSSKINGVQQQVREPIGGGFRADTCDFVETKFETFNGPPEKASIDFPNCEPNATEPSKVTIKWSSTAAQGQGTYTVTQQGGGGGLFGALTGSWLKHKGTLDMTINSASAGDTETRDVPPGKVLALEFTPKMQRMTGEWRVHIDASPGNFAVNPSPEQNFAAPEVVEGPHMLAGAAGAPGVVDGEIKPIITDC